MLNFSSTESEGGEIDVLSVSPKKGPEREKWKRKRKLALYQSKKKRRKVHQTPYPANPDRDEVNPDEVTFQAIVHNVSTRIHLYHLSSMKTYNQRAVSTLAVENMFSDLSALCNTSSGIPLAANIPRYISRMTQLNSIHQNPEKLV